MGRAPCCDKANVKKGPWSPEEDAKLKEYIERHGTGGNWIALPQKAGMLFFYSCNHFDHMYLYGFFFFQHLSLYFVCDNYRIAFWFATAGLKRCGKSCRLRWLNYLRPNIKHGAFSEEEDNIICNLFTNIGSRYPSFFKSHFPLQFPLFSLQFFKHLTKNIV